ARQQRQRRRQSLIAASAGAAGGGGGGAGGGGALGGGGGGFRRARPPGVWVGCGAPPHQPAPPPRRWGVARGCACRGRVAQRYAILARAASVSCRVNARRVSVWTLPSDPNE